MSSASEVVTLTTCGRSFRATRHTHAHLAWTQERLSASRPGTYIRVIQPSYNTGVEASAGTHDRDAVLDVEIVGLSWSEAQWFLRHHGWAAWWRTPAQGFTHHIHMVSLGSPGEVGIYVPGQINDYYHHTYGLKDQHTQDMDKSRFPGDVGPGPWPVGEPGAWKRAIDATVFDFERWEQEKMGFTMNGDDKTYLDARFDKVQAALDKLGEKVQKIAGNTVKRDLALRKQLKQVGIADDKQADAILAAIAEVDAQMDDS